MTLRIYAIALQMVRDIAPIAVAVDRRDPDLARQMRRAASSVVLNIGEGAYSRGRNASARFHTAMGSAAEVVACLDVAEALSYTRAVEPTTRQRLQQVIGTLARLTRA